MAIVNRLNNDCVDAHTELITSLAGKRSRCDIYSGFLLRSSMFLLFLMPNCISAGTFYVSRVGNNTNGLSWETAWNEMSQIDWTLVQPGDVIMLDGGTNEMVYQTMMHIKASGTQGAPIVIRRSNEPGRNGTVRMFGGRNNPLPYCRQNDYVSNEQDVVPLAIWLYEQEYIVIDGMKWSGIKIHGFGGAIRFKGLEWRTCPGASNLVFRNIEIYDIGTTRLETWGLRPHGGAMGIRGHNITFERILIYDHGNDCFHGDNFSNLTLRESWLFNTRACPDNLPFNYCTHSDAFQMYWANESIDGRLYDGPMLIEDCIVGPGFMQGVFLGYQGTDDIPERPVNDVTVRNVTFFGNMGSGNIKTQGTPRRWLLENVTSYALNNESGRQYCKSMQFYAVTPEDFIIRNSLFAGTGDVDVADRGVCPQVSGNYVSNEKNTYSHKCRDLGTAISLPFAKQPSNWQDDWDFSLPENSPAVGKGSRITSSKTFFDLFPDESNTTGFRIAIQSQGAGKNSAAYAYPNPHTFDKGPMTFTTPFSMRTGRLVVFSPSGKIAALVPVDGNCRHVLWNGAGVDGATVSAGVYHYRFMSGNETLGRGKYVLAR